MQSLEIANWNVRPRAWRFLKGFQVAKLSNGDYFTVEVIYISTGIGDRLLKYRAADD